MTGSYGLRVIVVSVAGFPATLYGADPSQLRAVVWWFLWPTGPYLL